LSSRTIGVEVNAGVDRTHRARSGDEPEAEGLLVDVVLDQELGTKTTKSFGFACSM
jgi:hypothetical protein